MPLTLPPRTRLVVATHNAGKAAEIAELLDGRFETVAAGALGLPEPEETEATFMGNAVLKARAAADASGLVAIADDSGISVAGLGGDPGVLSARWGEREAGQPRDFGFAMRRVERELAERGSQDRRAWFSCALAVAWPQGAVVAVEGRVDGNLVFPGRGARGHGYDPIFAPEGGALTFGEMEAGAKNAVSHRARAFQALKAALFLNLGPPPLGLYVHWPYCARICPYCDFNVYRDRGRLDEQAALVDAIAADMAAQAALTGPRRLVSIFFGGGTPSLMRPDDVARLIEAARRLWSPADDLEITLEANPTDAEQGRFAAFAEAGVGRLSLGVQALEDEALAFLGRNHDAAAARRAVEAAARVFPRVSLDLIYALPGQTLQAWTTALRRAVDLGAEHISPYQLTIEDGAAFGRAARRGRLVPPGEDLGADLFEATQDVLDALGFEAYEVSNHARGVPARARHNLVCWRGQDYAGVGPGAHGRLTTGEGRIASEAAARPSEYISAVRNTGFGWALREPLTARATSEERLLAGLRTVEGVSWADLGGLGLSRSHGNVHAMAALGLIVAHEDGLQATRQGRLVLDRVIAELAG